MTIDTNIRPRHSKLPLLRGTIEKVNPLDREWGVIVVYCPICRLHHRHSWLLAKPARPEHRNAHCQISSPFYELGYLIAPWRACDPESKAHAVQPGRKPA